MKSLREDEITTYIRELVAIFPSIKEVWLFGSRANNTIHPKSDWDFLVFADEAILKELKEHTEYQKDNVDLAIVYNGDDIVFVLKNGKHESGDFKFWEWQRMSETEAKYTGVKWVADDEEGTRKFCSNMPNVAMGEGNISKCRAVKVWPTYEH
jgi:predicted nucleotidyltransferase